MNKQTSNTVSVTDIQKKSKDTPCIEEYCRTVDNNEIPLSKRLQIRLGIPKKAFSIESPVIPNKYINYFYVYCKVHGYYQTYPHGSGYLECPIELKERLNSN